MIGSFMAFPSLSFAAPIFDVRPGTVVVYSDGDVERLMSRSSDSSTWEDSRKRVYERSHLGFFGDLSESRFPPGSRETRWSASPESLARLENATPGSSVTYSVRRTRDGVPKDLSWSCTYNGVKNTTVLDTQLLVKAYDCSRYSVSVKRGSSFKEQREVLYSPDLEMVVWERNTLPGRDPKERQIKAILTPEQASMDAITEVVKQ